MRFADDVLLFASSKEQLQKMLCEFKKSTEKVGLRIHPGKTKIQSNQRSNTRKELEVDNIRVEILTRGESAKKSSQGCLGDASQVQTGTDIEELPAQT